MADHIHTAGDGRGYRNVFVNGNLIPNVEYADTKKGVVYFAPNGIQLMRKNREKIYTRKLNGIVTVEPIN